MSQKKTLMKKMLFLPVLLLSLCLWGQDDERRERIEIEGRIVTAFISDGDTIIVADLDDISVSSLYDFGSRSEYNRYRKYRRYANKVYPYAVESIKIFRQMEWDTRDMTKRKRKRHNRKLNKKLKKKFKKRLKNLSKTQGLILTKMIERHLDISMYDLIKNTRSGAKAYWWHKVGKLNGYDLKEKYKPGVDRVLDVVLQDYDISYDVTAPTAKEDSPD